MTDAARLPSPRHRPRITADGLLTTCGISVAAASISFASYMLSFGPSELKPRMNGEFGVFAQFDRRPRFSAGHDAGESRPGTEPIAQPHPQPTPAVAADLDFLPTGSVAASAAVSRPAPDAVPVTPPLRDFVLREVIDGAAVVQNHDRLSVVRPGSVLAGAGAVRAIERDGRDWVVLTDRGTIVGQPRGPRNADRSSAAAASREAATASETRP